MDLSLIQKNFLMWKKKLMINGYVPHTHNIYNFLLIKNYKA
jgi:hypothetical protein